MSIASLPKRLALGIGANAIGKVWIILIQIVSIPVLIVHWGAGGYGTWLMLSAVPTYIALSDLGFSTAAGFAMTSRAAREEYDGARSSFQSVWVLLLLASATLIAVGLAGSVIWIMTPYFEQRNTEVVIAACLLCLYALILLQTNLLYMAYKAANRYIEGTLLLDLLVPLEGGAVLSLAWVGAHYGACAAALVVVRSCGLAMYYTRLRRYAPWLKYGFAEASSGEIRALVKPAIAALSLPLSTALNIQGIIFAIGFALSPAAVAVFGPIRTISRVPLQVVSLLSRTTLPEITIAFSQTNHARLARLIAVNCLALIAVAVPSATVIALWGQAALDILSRGHVSAPPGLFDIMAIVVLFQMIWNTAATFLLALNMQHRFAHIFAGLSLASFGTAFAVAPKFGLNGVAGILLVVDVTMSIVIIREWLKVTGMNGASVLSNTVDLVPWLFQMSLDRLERWRASGSLWK